MKKSFLALAAAACLASGTAHASTAITSFTGGTLFPSFDSDDTVGFTFTALANITVNQVGWYSTDGTIEAPHEVGIWNLAGTLLNSATVTAGTPDGTGFRYVAFTPTNLISGMQYFIGGRDTDADGDSYVTSVSDLVVGPDISYIGSAVSNPGGAGFAYPSEVNTVTTGGRFGPNFQYELTSGGVPEPATWAMMLLGFGLMGASMRRKQAARVRFAF